MNFKYGVTTDVAVEIVGGLVFLYAPSGWTRFLDEAATVAFCWNNWLAAWSAPLRIETWNAGRDKFETLLNLAGLRMSVRIETP